MKSLHLSRVIEVVRDRTADGTHLMRDALTEYEGCQTWEDVAAIAEARTHSASAARKYLVAYIHDTIRDIAENEEDACDE
jgi:hypothetical protein